MFRLLKSLVLGQAAELEKMYKCHILSPTSSTSSTTAKASGSNKLISTATAKATTTHTVNDLLKRNKQPQQQSHHTKSDTPIKREPKPNNTHKSTSALATDPYAQLTGEVVKMRLEEVWRELSALDTGKYFANKVLNVYTHSSACQPLSYIGI